MGFKLKLFHHNNQLDHRDVKFFKKKKPEGPQKFVKEDKTENLAPVNIIRALV